LELEDERFALVLLDFDLYQPPSRAFRYFYPRLVDFNSPVPDRATSRAAGDFLAHKAEALIEIPDQWGSGVFRKSRLDS